jgi:hypothetical protein
MPAQFSLETFMASNSGDAFIETARLIAGENPQQSLIEYLENGLHLFSWISQYNPGSRARQRCMPGLKG